MGKITEIGTCEAIVSGIRTLKDGSFEIKFEVNPDDHSLINRLIKMYSLNETLVTIGIVRNDT